MIGSPSRLRIVEPVDRRVLGAIRVVDAVTRLPVEQAGAMRPVRAELLRDGENVEVPLPDDVVVLRRSRSGLYTLFRAPFFDAYIAAFSDPQDPEETEDGPLRIVLALEDPGPRYLPQSFSFELPRPVDPEADESVFDPVQVPLLRAPSAPVQHGWATVRARVAEEDTDPPAPLPGVLLRVFRDPRDEGDAPIGWGMTDWRGRLRGEALVVVAGVQRFRPGSQGNVIESDLPVVIEAARTISFTGAEGSHPDLGALLDAIPQDPDDDAGPEVSLVREAHSLRVEAGREYSIEVSMP